MRLFVKFANLLKYLFHAKKVWSRPRRTDLLICDATGSEVLLDYLDPWEPEILHLGAEQINIPSLFRSLFFRGKRQEAYIDAYVKYVAPRLVITRIDNALHFYTITKRHEGLKTLSIQNGTRGYYADIFEQFDLNPQLAGKLHADMMLVFGNHIGNALSKHIQGTVIPIGSFRNNLVKKSYQKQRNTIAFVSQYRETNGFTMGQKFYSFHDFFEQADRLILPFLSDYAVRNNKKLIVVPCYGRFADDRLENEKNYYRGLLGSDVNFSDWAWHGSSYEALDAAEVTVSIDSSMGLESAARGNKSAIFSIRGHLLSLLDPPFLSFGWPGTYPDVGPFWCNLPDTAYFEQILDHLFSVDNGEWAAELKSNSFCDVIEYDPGNSVFQSLLARELGTPSP